MSRKSLRDVTRPDQRARGGPNARDSMRFDNQQFIFQEENDRKLFPENGQDGQEF